MLFWKGWVRGARLKGDLDMCMLSVVEHTKKVVSDMAAAGV